ncbi:MAG TPA: ATP-binding protein [Vicinamibacterales bacterium]|nr:ATP-binding protein [Vicinamibacterales bacterium]
MIHPQLFQSAAHTIVETSIIRVLVVDDDRSYGSIVKRLLRDSTWARYQIETLTTYAEAIAAEPSRFDVVLLDYHLDVNTGFDVLRTWRGRAEETPVLMLTAAGNDAVDFGAATAGAADYLDKAALEPRGLERAIRYAIAAHRSIRAMQQMMRWQFSLSRAARALLDVTDAPSLAGRAVQAAVQELDASGGWLGEACADGTIEPLAGYPQLPEYVEKIPARWDETPAGGGPSGRAIRAGLPITVDVVRDPQFELWRDIAVAAEIRSLTAFPLRTQEGTIGVLNIYSTEDDFFTPAVIEVFATHAHMAALALRGLRLQEQLRHSQKLEAIGRLAGGVAHDFNNLLTAIIGHSALLLDEPLDPAVRESVEEIRAAGERAAALTRQLLAFGRRQVMRPEVLDANQTIRGVEPLLRRLMPANIRVETRLGADPSFLRADHGQLEQVLVNLAVNARDAMPRGGTMQISSETTVLTDPVLAPEGVVEPGRYVVLAVSDTGHGMNAATRARIFEPFFTSKPPGQGTGLGLATVLGIVQQSGGRITVQSQPGSGSRFTLYFPLVEAP